MSKVFVFARRQLHLAKVRECIVLTVFWPRRWIPGVGRRCCCCCSLSLRCAQSASKSTRWSSRQTVRRRDLENSQRPRRAIACDTARNAMSPLLQAGGLAGFNAAMQYRDCGFSWGRGCSSFLLQGGADKVIRAAVHRLRLTVTTFELFLVVMMYLSKVTSTGQNSRQLG